MVVLLAQQQVVVQAVMVATLYFQALLHQVVVAVVNHKVLHLIRVVMAVPVVVAEKTLATLVLAVKEITETIHQAKVIMAETLELMLVITPAVEVAVQEPRVKKELPQMVVLAETEDKVL
jgi:hypothetical protein